MLAFATTIAVLAFDVLYGIAIAIGLSVLNLLRRIVRPHDAVLGFAPGVAGMHDIEDYPDATQVPGLMVYRYDAPLFFADADNFRTRALRSIDEAEDPVRWFLLNAEANTEIDFTAADIMEELRAELADRGITLALARVKFEVRQDLQKAGLIDAIGPAYVFATLPTAVEAYRTWAAADGVAVPAVRWSWRRRWSVSAEFRARSLRLNRRDRRRNVSVDRDLPSAAGEQGVAGVDGGGPGGQGSSASTTGSRSPAPTL